MKKPVKIEVDCNLWELNGEGLGDSHIEEITLPDEWAAEEFKIEFFQEITRFLRRWKEMPDVK